MTASDDEVLKLLKTRGPISTAGVADALRITPQGARQRLETLRRAGLVGSGRTKGTIGRPGLSWSLSEAGHAQFPDGHDRLAVELIETIRCKLGVKALDRLIAAREAEQHRRYRAAVAAATGLAEKLSCLARERTREGYMAEFTRRPTAAGCSSSITARSVPPPRPARVSAVRSYSFFRPSWVRTPRSNGSSI